MNAADSTIGQYCEQLADVLTLDIRHITENIERLNDLRAAIIKRDDQTLNDMLCKIQADAGSYACTENARRSIIQKLAGLLDCRAEKLTLGFLIEQIDEPVRRSLCDLRQRLQQLIEQIRIEHAKTVMLVNECSRLNSMMMEMLFKCACDESGTYNSAGATKRFNNNVFINMQL